MARSFTHPLGQYRWEYYSLAPITSNLGSIFLEKVCEGETPALDSCDSIAAQLAEATYVDIDYDIDSQAVTLTALWGLSAIDTLSKSDRAARTIRKIKPEDRIEVGVLQAEQSDEPGELSSGGYLTVIGENDLPGATFFSFPSRHHTLPPSTKSSFSATFQDPSGLHPKLDIILPGRSLQPPRDTCALYAYWTLPSALFIDRYQFSDALFLASQNLIALSSLTGEDDLEAPDWTVEKWGSTALFELAHSLAPTDAQASGDEDWTITIPTHLRYVAGAQLETDPPGYATVELPWPTVFWACRPENDLKTSGNPFDRVDLGYDGLFDPRTIFYHVEPVANASRLVAQVKVPVLGPESAQWVRSGTAAVVMLGFAWICWKMFTGTSRSRTSTEKKAQ